MAGKKQSETFNITLPQPIYKKVLEKAKQLKVSRSAVVRHMLINAFDQEAKEQASNN